MWCFQTLAVLSLIASIHADNPPCPPLGPNFPLPTSISSSPIVASGIQDLEKQLESSIVTGNSSNGPTTPNTTSFSIALFSVENTNSSSPFLWQFHHSAPSLSNSTQGVRSVDENSVYRIGTLSQLFTVYAFLIAAGEEHWGESVTKWVPELANASKTLNDQSKYVDWNAVTLGDLAGHLSGIARDYGVEDLSSTGLDLAQYGLPQLSEKDVPLCGEGDPCSREEFFQGFTQKAPVYLPGTTPSYSNAGFQILAYALEGITGRKYEDVLNESILSQLQMNQTTLVTAPDSTLGVIPGNANTTGWGESYGEDPALSMYSNLHDLAIAGTSVISSSLLSSASTRRWLKPISSTSNPVNMQGRPWEIYNAVGYENAPVTEIFTVIGNIGHCSSYIGLVPNYGVGFVMLAADSEGTADLNAYVDFIFEAVTPALEQAAVAQAIASYAGMYTSGNGTQMSIEVDGTPGLVVTELMNNGADVRAGIAKLKGIEPDALIFRLYPSNVQSEGKMNFRAIWQDNNDLADAGTPTCISWMDIEDLVYGGESLDKYVFELDDSGNAKTVEIPALRTVLGKE